MALVSAGFHMDVVLRGSSNKTSTMRFPLRAATYADAVTAGAGIRTALNNVTSAVTTRYNIREQYIEDALLVPGAVDLTDVMVLSGGIDGDLSKVAAVRVPGFDRAGNSTLLVAQTGINANKIDITAAAVEAYWDLFASTGPCFISDGEDAEPTANNGLYSGRLTSRASSEP